MINGNVNEFISGLYYGDERVFLYKNEKFFIQGLKEERVYSLYLDRWEPPSDDYIWRASSAKDYPVDQFLEAKIFDGKSFWNVENEIEWIDA